MAVPANTLSNGVSGGFELLRHLLGDPDTTSTDPALENLQSKCRAHINRQNDHRYGNTPLVVAVLYNYVDCIRLLLEHGADPRIPGEGGYSALDFATKRQYTEAAGLLKAHMFKSEPERR